MISRLKKDGQSSHREEKLKWKSVSAVFKDWKLYVVMVIQSGEAGALYSIALFLPTIIHELGYTATTAQLLTVPPYVFGFIFVFISDMRR